MYVVHAKHIICFPTLNKTLKIKILSTESLIIYIYLIFNLHLMYLCTGWDFDK